MKSRKNFHTFWAIIYEYMRMEMSLSSFDEKGKGRIEWGHRENENVV